MRKADHGQKAPDQHRFLACSGFRKRVTSVRFGRRSQAPRQDRVRGAALGLLPRRTCQLTHPALPSGLSPGTHSLQGPGEEPLQTRSWIVLGQRGLRLRPCLSTVRAPDVPGLGSERPSSSRGYPGAQSWWDPKREELGSPLYRGGSGQPEAPVPWQARPGTPLRAEILRKGLQRHALRPQPVLAGWITAPPGSGPFQPDDRPGLA